MQLNHLEILIADLIADTPSRGKHAAASAIEHIKKAFALKAIDMEMAAFRAINGKAEAANYVT